jgi:acetyl-CoA synthetase (ADP-forming)
MQQQDFNKTVKLLDKYKLPYPKSKLATSLEKAIKIAKAFGYPVVLKIISKDIIHKSDVGGVKTNLQNEKELTSAYENLLKSVKKKSPRSKIEGVLVQKMGAGIEVIIGMKQDSQFGPVLMFGLGGIFVEVMKDVSFRVAPINKDQAEEMINEVKSSAILKGTRGVKPIKISALVDLLVKTSKLSVENKKILELDFNPVMVDEKSAKIIDVRIMIE